MADGSDSMMDKFVDLINDDRIDSWSYTKECTGVRNIHVINMWFTVKSSATKGGYRSVSSLYAEDAMEGIIEKAEEFFALLDGGSK